ncbi:PAP2 family protein [Ancylomarina longa]|uniref:PAP2 family protein n=1 Tax=Ancylomarina longa TaxID=2487017 RepID=A0A434AFH9_9BACT|nr:PAP2 family protein [Ancylomarina longa]RUT73137.1 PAP2 family protein [Ancylomarina longa]
MKLSRIISGIAHPMLMPLYSVFVIFHSGTYLDYSPSQLIRVIYLIVAISTIFLPLSLLPLLKSQNLISDYGIEKSRERFIPLVFVILFYSLGAYLLWKFPIIRPVANIQIAAIISIALIAIISLKWKISIHMAGIGGFLGLLIALSFLFSSSLRVFFVIGILIAGLLAFSRLKLNLHSPLQVYAGFILGFVTIFSSILLF